MAEIWYNHPRRPCVHPFALPSGLICSQLPREPKKDAVIIYVCVDCLRIFKSPSALTAHMESSSTYVYTIPTKYVDAFSNLFSYIGNQLMLGMWCWECVNQTIAATSSPSSKAATKSACRSQAFFNCCLLRKQLSLGRSYIALQGLRRKAEGCRSWSRRSKVRRSWRSRRSKIRRSKRSGPESESGGPRPRCQDLSWRINRWENPIVFWIAFSLPTNETYLLT